MIIPERKSVKFEGTKHEINKNIRFKSLIPELMLNKNVINRQSNKQLGTIIIPASVVKQDNRKLVNKIDSREKEPTPPSTVRLINCYEILSDLEHFEQLNNIMNQPLKSSFQIEFVFNHLKKLKCIKSYLEQHGKDSSVEFLQKLSIMIKAETMKRNKFLFHYGDQGNKFYIILKGKVAVLVPKEEKMLLTFKEFERYLEILKENGEDELLSKVENTNSHLILNKEKIMKLHSSKSPNEIQKTNKKQIKKEIVKSPSMKIIQDYISKIKPEIIIEKNLPQTKQETNNSPNLIPDMNAEKTVPVKIIKQEFIVYSYSHILTLGVGEKFGDFALHTNSDKRTASLLCIEDCIFGVLDKSSYDDCIKETNERLKKLYIQFTMKRSVFEGFELYDFLKKYYLYFINFHCDKGERLVIEGEKPEYVYFVRKGEFQVTMKKSIVEVKEIMGFLSNERKNIADKEINEMQFSSSYSKYIKEKNFIQLGIIKYDEIIGLEDSVYNDKILYTVECITPGELMKLNLSIYNRMVEEQDFVKRQTDIFVKEKRRQLFEKLCILKRTRLKYFKENLEGYNLMSLNQFIGDMFLDKKDFDIKTLKIDTDMTKTMPIKIIEKSTKKVLSFNPSSLQINKETNIISSPNKNNKNLEYYNISTANTNLKSFKRNKSAPFVDSFFVSSTIDNQSSIKQKGRNKGTLFTLNEEKTGKAVNLLDCLAFDTMKNTVKSGEHKVLEIVKKHEKLKKDSIGMMTTLQDNKEQTMNRREGSSRLYNKSLYQVGSISGDNWNKSGCRSIPSKRVRKDFVLS